MKENKTNCGVYHIINLLPDELTGVIKIYTGSSENLKSRKWIHFNDLKKGKHHCIHLQNAYNKIKNKYGEDKVRDYFEFRPILSIEKIEDKIKLKEILLEHENIELNKYKKEDGCIDHSKCYNILTIAGSPLGSVCSKETKQKLREFNLGKKHSNETKEKISKSNKGKKHTQETVEKILESRKNYKHSNETKEKISNTLRGRKLTIETKEKLRQVSIGKKHSKERNENKSISQKGIKLGRIWIHRDKETKMINKIELSKWKKEGFVIGRGKRV